MMTLRRPGLFVFLALAAASTAAACSSASSNDAPAIDPSDGGPGVDGATTAADAPSRDANVTPPADAKQSGVLPACLGTSIPVAITTGPHATLKVGAAPSPYAGAFLIDYATTGSTIDLSVFAAPGPTATSCNPAQLGQLCTFADLDFFGPWGQVTLRTSTATILGTDFLAHGIFTLDYTTSRMLNSPKATACTDAQLTAAGFAALSTAGFFVDDLSRLKPQHDVDDSASAGITVANVPVVPVRIAGTAAIAQLDTGFDDKVVTHSINVNVAFFDAIDAAAPGALLRDPASDVSLSTCAGVSEPGLAYHFAAGRAFELLDEQGKVAHAWADATIFVKQTPAAAIKCGGIGTWSSPAAQIGTSFFTDIGALVFDPYASRVWVAR